MVKGRKKYFAWKKFLGFFSFGFHFLELTERGVLRELFINRRIRTKCDSNECVASSSDMKPRWKCRAIVRERKVNWNRVNIVWKQPLTTLQNQHLQGGNLKPKRPKWLTVTKLTPYRLYIAGTPKKTTEDKQEGKTRERKKFIPGMIIIFLVCFLCSFPFF